MKIYFKYSLPALFALLLTGPQLFSQDSTDMNSLPPVTVKPSSLQIPDRVWKGLERYFANAENPSWYALKRNYMVRFMTEDRGNQALFTRRGNLIYNINYGSKKDLPENERRMVMNSYFDYEITNVLKVTDGRRMIWLVNVEDPKNTMMLRIEDGQLDEIQKYKKS